MDIWKPFLAVKAAWSLATHRPPWNINSWWWSWRWWWRWRSSNMWKTLIFKHMANILKYLFFSSLSSTLFSSNEATESAKSLAMNRLRRDLNKLDRWQKSQFIDWLPSKLAVEGDLDICYQTWIWMATLARRPNCPAVAENPFRLSLEIVVL